MPRMDQLVRDRATSKYASIWPCATPSRISREVEITHVGGDREYIFEFLFKKMDAAESAITTTRLEMK